MEDVSGFLRNVLEREIRFEKAGELKKEHPLSHPFFGSPKMDKSEVSVGMHAISELHVQAQEGSKSHFREAGSICLEQRYLVSRHWCY